VANPYAATYRQFWRLNTLTLLEYKLNFFIWLFFTIVYHGIAIGTIWIMMSRFPLMNGWHWQEVFFLYALWMVGHTLNNTLFFTVGNVPDHIREGDFDRFLVRPLDPLFQVLSQPGQIWPDELAVALIVFAVAQGVVHLQWTLASTTLLVLAFAGGALIDFAVQLAVATLAFWVVRLDTLRWVVMSLERFHALSALDLQTRSADHARLHTSVCIHELFSSHNAAAQNRRDRLYDQPGTRMVHARRRRRVVSGSVSILASWTKPL